MSNWVALLAIQFGLGTVFGLLISFFSQRRRRRKQLSTIDRLLGLELRSASYVERGVAYVHPSVLPVFDHRETIRRYWPNKTQEAP